MWKKVKLITFWFPTGFLFTLFFFQEALRQVEQIISVMLHIWISGVFKGSALALRVSSVILSD